MRHAVTLAAALLVGCAGPKEFERGQATEAQFTRDQAECELEGEKHRSAGGYGGLAAVAEFEESFARVYNACMKARGYSVKTS